MEEKIMEKDMIPILIKDLGSKYPKENSKHKRRYGLYQCQYCGKEFETKTQDVKGNKVKSCGCQSNKHRNPHGLRSHPLYQTWNGMMQRCHNPKNIRYENYGGRGITICERWLDISNFVEDMYPSWKEGLSLDRIDVNGNYELDNIRWATLSVQQQNTRGNLRNTSGFRGVSYHKNKNKWGACISVNSKSINLGYHSTALEAAKAYETYVRLNNLEHNFTPALTEEEVGELNKQIGEIL